MFWTGATHVCLPILIDHRGVILLLRLTPAQREAVFASGIADQSKPRPKFWQRWQQAFSDWNWSE